MEFSNDELECVARFLGWLELRQRMAAAGIILPGETAGGTNEAEMKKGEVQEYCREQSKAHRSKIGKLVTRDWWDEFCRRYEFPRPKVVAEREILWDAREVKQFWRDFEKNS